MRSAQRLCNVDGQGHRCQHDEVYHGPRPHIRHARGHVRPTHGQEHLKSVVRGVEPSAKAFIPESHRKNPDASVAEAVIIRKR